MFDVHVKIDSELEEMLKYLESKLGKKRSEVVREAIKTYYKIVIGNYPSGDVVRCGKLLDVDVCPGNRICIDAGRRASVCGEVIAVNDYGVALDVNGKKVVVARGAIKYLEIQ